MIYCRSRAGVFEMIGVCGADWSGKSESGFGV